MSESRIDTVEREIREDQSRQQVLRTVAARLRYLASSAPPDELEQELHALARMCEDAAS